ncbi:MAG: DNA internalization-related competence protein ComEC/Rec2, partial [Candidatus Binatia bacterium]
MEAVHYREPDRLPDRSRWYLRVERIWLPNGAEEVEGNLLVTVERDAREWQYLDRVRLWLRARPPRNLGNPGGFDYESYLARRRIYLTGFLPSDAGVELLQREERGFWGWIESLRREIRQFLEKNLSGDEAALLKALVIGDMGGITKEMRERSAAAGVAHVLSISGLHVGMLGLVVFFLVRTLGSASTTVLLRWNLLKVATFSSFIAVLFYTCIAGAMVPTVRSAIMIGVYELAVLLDREEEVFSSLALAALLIGLAWPGVVMEISFQLSFLSVLSIVWGLRKAQDLWPVRKERVHPKETNPIRAWVRRWFFYFAVPLFATIGTGPLIAHHFGHLSLAGFFSNPLIVPLVGFVVVPLGLLAGFLALVWSAAARAVLSVAGPLSVLTNRLVDFFADLPLAQIAVPIPSLLEIAFVYSALLALLLLRKKIHLYLLSGACACAVLASGAYGWPDSWKTKELRIAYLSVGQGDAAVVEFPGSKVLVIDAGGSASDFDPGESVVAPYLRARKILRVDYLFVSHPRVDHYGGMRTLVQQFSPLEFWSAEHGPAAARFEELERVLLKHRVNKTILTGEDECRWIEDVELCVLHAPSGEREESVVIRLTYGRASFLFAGDAEKREEKAMLGRRADLASTVLKVPRHGSLTSSTPEFVRAVKPALAIISVGRRNPFGLPREEVVARYLEQGSLVLRTDEDGAVMLQTNGKTVRYETYKSGKRGSVALDAGASSQLWMDSLG